MQQMLVTNHRRMDLVRVMLALSMVVAGVALLLSLNGIGGHSRDEYDSGTALRAACALRGFAAALLTAGGLTLGITALPATDRVHLRKPKHRASLVLTLAGVLVACGATAVIAFIAAYSNSSGEAAYEYTGPHRSSPFEIWLVLIPVALVFAFLFRARPRICAVGLVLVVVTGFLAVLTDDAFPTDSAFLWTLASVPLLTAALLALWRETRWMGTGRAGLETLVAEGHGATSGS